MRQPPKPDDGTAPRWSATSGAPGYLAPSARSSGEHDGLGGGTTRTAEEPRRVTGLGDRGVYRLCYIRGPEGLLIGLAEEIG